MIGHPFNSAMFFAYCADTGADQPKFQLNYAPFLARGRNLTEQQAREADRLRKMANRLPDFGFGSRGSQKARAFVQQLLRHAADRMGRTAKIGFEYADMEAAVCAFCDKYKISVKNNNILKKMYL